MIKKTYLIKFYQDFDNTYLLAWVDTPSSLELALNEGYKRITRREAEHYASAERYRRKHEPSSAYRADAEICSFYERYILEHEEDYFNDFMAASEGCFDGFKMPNIFHQYFKKSDAVFTTEADDKADAITPFGVFHTGIDGVKAYFMSEKPTKFVGFNRSVYFI